MEATHIGTVAELKLFLRPGHIVTVHDEEIIFDKMQGEVVTVNKGKIGVEFDQQLYGVHPAFSMRLCQPGKPVIFSRTQLILEQDWSPENKLKRAFPYRNYSNLQLLERPFALGTRCMCHECLEDAISRIFVNVHGTVADYDVCGQHSKQYGNSCLPDFPASQEAIRNMPRSFSLTDEMIRILKG